MGRVGTPGIAGVIGKQLRCPSGFCGRLVGRAMEVVNRGAYRETIARLGICQDDTVLELGCGPGQGLSRLRALASRGRIDAVDASGEMLRRARRRNDVAIGAGRIALVGADFAALPFQAGRFDRVLAVNVVYFWIRPDAVLSEILRVMKPRGRLAIFATHRSSMEKWAFAGADTHRHFDEESLESMLRLAGFSPPDIRIDRIVMGAGVQGLCATADSPGSLQSAAG